MQDKPARRELVFHNLDEVVADVENLRAKGYSKAGNWDLAQVCGHLATWMSYAVDGYPKPGCLMGCILWLMKMGFGRRMLRKMLATGAMNAGLPTMKETVALPGGDEAASVSRLKEIVQRFKDWRGEVHPSPLLGRLTREESTKLQLIHSALHLSFLIPNLN